MMILFSRTRPVPVFGALALFVVLASGAETSAQKKKKGPPVPPAAKLQEAAVLRTAYMLIAAANPNYHGHRVKAMNRIEQAVTILDKSVYRQGTNGQKLLALQSEIKVEADKFRARHSGKVHTPQALSDLQVQEAGRLLANVRVVLAANKQVRVVKHVDAAIHEVQNALRARRP